MGAPADTRALQQCEHVRNVRGFKPTSASLGRTWIRDSCGKATGRLFGGGFDLDPTPADRGPLLIEDLE